MGDLVSNGVLRRSNRTYRWLPLVMLVTLSSALLTGWWWAISAARSSAEQRDRVLVEQTALRVSDWVNSRLAILSSLRTLEQLGHDRDRSDWIAHVTVTIDHLGGFQAINWIDERGVIARIAPVAGNEAALGRSVLRHPGAGRYLAANGFAGDPDHAIYRYNHADQYVRAVNDFAAVLAADPAAFAGYYNWDVYYATTAGDVLLPIGYAESTAIPVGEYLAGHPQ